MLATKNLSAILFIIFFDSVLFTLLIWTAFKAYKILVLETSSLSKGICVITNGVFTIWIHNQSFIS